MYSVMKTQNGCYIKMSSHAMSSFHVPRLSRNAKVPASGLIFFRHCYANCDILLLLLFLFIFFICLKVLNVTFFWTLGVGELMIYPVFNFQYISKRVNDAQISCKRSGITVLIHCFGYTYLNPFSTNLVNYYLSFCAIAYVGKQHFLWSLAICCMLSSQKRWHLEC